MCARVVCAGLCVRALREDLKVCHWASLRTGMVSSSSSRLPAELYGA